MSTPHIVVLGWGFAALTAVRELRRRATHPYRHLEHDLPGRQGRYRCGLSGDLADPPRNVTWAKKGKWVHLAKVAFEQYFRRKMKTGNSESPYEKYVLKALGIKRLN